jgi:transcriptional regulator with XRE-family HTH domain
MMRYMSRIGTDTELAAAVRADELIAAEIRAQLARARITQSTLAQRLGVSRAWVSRRLSGEVPLSVGDVAVIARKLGASFTTLTAPVAAEIEAEHH